jgi:hypothetical protein
MQIGGSYRHNIGTGIIVDGTASVNHVSMMIRQLSFASRMRPLTLQRVFWWLRSATVPLETGSSFLYDWVLDKSRFR